MESTTQPRGPAVPAAAIIGTVVIGATLFHVWLHQRVHGVYNPTQIGLAFFLVINVLVAWWEIALFVCQDQIHAEYEATKERYRGTEMTRIAEIFARPIPLLNVLSFSQWTTIWSGYSLFDPGYSDRRSFGYNIDVGNGFTTLIPALVFASGMTFEWMPARVLGIIGIILFWQMFYGTAVYFFQFFNNDRHKGHSLRDLVVFVGITNLMWFVFPLWGLWASVELILDGSYRVFL
ncbi:MAG: hypothetical protein JRG93_14750 [Deltaproteobacteria bacterium]|nr:hypothetical protein [Deltaproteobacteria bacterium]MBW2223889.1 hypothetical protein [Deltaproteobacteria bacterium]MBW2402568.1 hypothetical protein [Deltaproteobacteria bacterium]MBW2548245.1 hypothetical protein [Deltaproteobacteria bacterium]MBW2717342.1 hypothetical protein [Deltaproteobacteria bacterium]